MFDDTIKVKAEKIDVLEENVVEEFLTPELDLNIDDLISTEKNVSQKYYNMIEPNTAFFPKTSSRPLNFFEQIDGPQRTLLSNRYEDVKKIPKNDITFAVKGSGFWSWPINGIVFEDSKRTKRVYPIVKNHNPRFPSHKFWGGMEISFATHEYISAMILNALIQRHSLPQSTYVPISIVKPELFPIMEDKTQKIVTIDEYCKKGFRNVNSKFSVPNQEEMNETAQYIYAGELVGLRVPPTTYFYLYSPISSRGILSKEYESAREVLTKIDEFVINIASLLKTVHSYNGTFTSISKKRKISSLDKSNVTLSGVVCDLDTLSFGDASKKHKKIDISIAADTIANFTNLFEEKDAADTYNQRIYSKSNLASKARNLFFEYMEIPKKLFL